MAEPQAPGRDDAVAAPRTRRAGWTGMASIIAVGLLAGISDRRPLLVWNATASSPIGLYSLSTAMPTVGDFVLAWPPADAAGFAEARGYLPRSVPLVKTMVGGDGDRICAKGRRVWVNGRLVAVRLPADRAGRALPWWSGCVTLARGEMMLLGLGNPDSFDGRYLGPTPPHHVLGRARLLWRA